MLTIMPCKMYRNWCAEVNGKKVLVVNKSPKYEGHDFVREIIEELVLNVCAERDRVRV